MIRWEEIQENRTEQSTIKWNTTERAENIVTKWKTNIINKKIIEMKYNIELMN